MFKTIAAAEVEIGDRKYILICPKDSPLGELHDAIMQMKGECVQRMITAHQEHEKQAEEQIKRDSDE